MSKEDEIFKNVFSYIGDNLTEKLTVEEIAKHVYLSPTYLQSVFKENYGVPLAEYVRRQKLQKARELLYNTQKRISDIAYDCGFEHESSFIRSFKREFGMTPGETGVWDDAGGGEKKGAAGTVQSENGPERFQ